MNNLFVYGTLKSSFENDMSRLLRSEAHFLSTGTVMGKLYEIDAYPGLILSSNPEDIVFGEIYTNVPSALLAVLDDYEGYAIETPTESEYLRITSHVTLGTDTVSCFIYIYQWPVNPENFIPGGRY